MSLKNLRGRAAAPSSGNKESIVLLDDCQWLGELEISLLARWAQSAPSMGRHTLVVAAFRAEEIPLDHALRAIENRCHISLSRLRPTDIRGVVESMAGPVPQDAMEVIHRLSEGSPFMAAAVLHGLVETGALVADQRGWKIEPESLQEVQSSRRAAALISKRLERLSPATRELLAKVRAGIESRVRDPVAATVSIGVACFVHPLRGRYTRPAEETIDTLLRRGDEALYRAKHGGRNRVEVSD